MSFEWIEYTLSDLGDIKTGKTPPAKITDAYVGNIPFITPRDIDGRKWIKTTERYLSDSGLASIKGSLVPGRSVAVSCIGSDMGKVVMVAKPSVTNQQINTVVVDEERFNAEFVYYNLSMRQDELKSIASGSATPILNKGHFSNVKVLLPSKKIQDSIVEILCLIDDKIELNRQINQTLEQIAQAIFKSWFVDFEPVKAKIAAKQNGQDPERAAMRAISGKTDEQLDQLSPDQFQHLATTAALFPDELVDSELGKIPTGWKQKRIDDILELAYGKALKSTDRIDGPVSVYGSGGLVGNHNESIADGPGIIIGRKGTVGSLYWENKPFFPIDTVFYVIPKVPLTFCFYLLQTLGLDHMNTDAAVPGLNRNNVYRLPVVINLKIAEIFDKFVKPLRERIFINDQQSKILGSIRDSLLPKLLSGEISLNDSSSSFEAITC